ncbi:MAG TPA: pyridoxamine 5'-phosphate oxidase family protein [Bacteroidia bacterium]|nr:pyridoxamine 5'-phosphate oxidase family protein [Bacteroidia bacterium]
MGKLFNEISPEIQSWIEKQKMFFVATAPLAANGHVNCSPKGLDSFRILSPTEVVYQDLTGSGAETIAHIQENNRITIMFCAFEGPPKIFRFYGEGQPVFPGDKKFDDLNDRFPKRLGVRAYILIKVTRITDSCGYGVPLYEFKGDRKQMIAWAENKQEDGILEYQKEKNVKSIDGLKALPLNTSSKNP